MRQTWLHHVSTSYATTRSYPGPEPICRSAQNSKPWIGAQTPTTHQLCLASLLITGNRSEYRFSRAHVLLKLARQSDFKYSRYGECLRAFNGWCEIRNDDPDSASSMVIPWACSCNISFIRLPGLPIGQLPITSPFLAGTVKTRLPPSCYPLGRCSQF